MRRDEAAASALRFALSAWPAGGGIVEDGRIRWRYFQRYRWKYRQRKTLAQGLCRGRRPRPSAAAPQGRPGRGRRSRAAGSARRGARRGAWASGPRPRGASPPRRAARGERRSWLTGAAQLSRPPPAGAGDGRYPGLLSGRPRTGLLSAGDNSGTDRRGGPTSGVRSYPASSGAPATEELPLRQLGQRALTFARSSSGTTGFSTNSCTGSHVSSRSFFVNLPT